MRTHTDSKNGKLRTTAHEKSEIVNRKICGLRPYIATGSCNQSLRLGDNLIEIPARSGPLARHDTLKVPRYQQLTPAGDPIYQESKDMGWTLEGNEF